MISQETQYQIEKEIEKKAYLWGNDKHEESFIIPIRLLRFAKHIAFDYAEKLEEKDKEIELLKQQATFSEEIESQLQVRIEQDLEKIESKDGEIEQLKVELEKCKFSHILTDESLQSLKEELDSKEAELAQLKEIAEKMINYLKDIERCGECPSCSENAGWAIDAYAEWCKQNLK